MTNEQTAKLEYPFTADEIEWRVLRTTKDKTKGQVAAFIDSRAIQKRLDTVLGRDNWQNHLHTIPGRDNSSTAHICELSIYYKERGEWISKCDGAGSTDIEPIKGGLSNAFKRAASMWGIGRYLYSLKNIWVPLKDGKYIPDEELPKLAKRYNSFVVKYLSAGTKATENIEAPTAPAQNNTIVQTRQQRVQLTEQSRFASNNTVADDSWKVVDMKVTKGANNEQTLLTLQKANGEAVSGYIKGVPPLQRGQSLCDLKIAKKNSPIVGDYNIVEDYKIAA